MGEAAGGAMALRHGVEVTRFDGVCLESVGLRFGNGKSRVDVVPQFRL